MLRSLFVIWTYCLLERVWIEKIKRRERQKEQKEQKELKLLFYVTSFSFLSYTTFLHHGASDAILGIIGLILTPTRKTITTTERQIFLSFSLIANKGKE